MIPAIQHRINKIWARSVLITLLVITGSSSEIRALDEGVTQATGSLSVGSAIFLGYTGAKWITNTVTVAKNKIQKKDKEKELQSFLQENHSLLAHDFASAEGTIFREIAIDLKLSEAEFKALRKNLEGSQEQLTILQSLDSRDNASGKVSLKQTRDFSIAFTSVLDRSLGAVRMAELFPEKD